MSLNLHSLVRSAINMNNADEKVYLIQSLGQANVKGRITAIYGEPELICAQVQSLGSTELNVINETERTEHDRKFYLFSKTATGKVPAGQQRPISRTGDYIYRFYDQTYWKIYNVAEDFSPAGWCQVLASQQIEIPQGVKDQMEKVING